MSSNQDARPFVDLRKDAKEFVEKFDGDIETIIAFLDAKITTLICDQDSPESPSKRGTVKSSALVEFSKAKFDVFNNVKSVMNQMEREWMKYILAMKKLFIENVEIFLAGTKLEVKLPTTEFQTSPSYKQSSRKDKPSLAESIYPIIPMFNSFAKNVAGFRSPFKKTDDNLDQGRRSRELKKLSYTVDENSSDSETEDERDSQRNEKGNQSSGSKSESIARQLQARAVSSSPKKYTESSSSDSESESEQSSAKPKGTPRTPTETRNSSRLSSSSANDAQSTEPQKDGPQNKATKKSLTTSTRGTNRNVSRVATSSPKGYTDLQTSSEGESESEYEQSTSKRSAMPKGTPRKQTRNSSRLSSSSANETQSTEPQQGRRQTRTRNKSLTASTRVTKSNASRVASSSPKSYADVVYISSEGESESDNEELSKSMSKKGKAVAKRNKGSKATSKQEAKKKNEKGLDSSRRSTGGKATEMSSSSSDAKETSVSSNRGQPRDKRGLFRPVSSKAKATPKAKVAPQKDTIPTPAMKNQARKLVTEENEDDDMEETSRSTRGRSGQHPVAPPVKQTPRSLRKKNTTSEESEDTGKIETNSSNTRSSRQRGGRTPASAVKPVKDVTQSASKGNKTRPAKHKLENSPDMDVPRSSRMKGTRGATPAPPSPIKSNLSSSTSVELDSPRSPKKVTFMPTRTLRIDDNMDVFTPSVKSKAAVRRKTLLPNLNMDISEDDVTPAISRGRAKRKTIGVISDLASATPPKRLKANEREKGASSSQAEEDTDNLLESDGNYSDWMPLKSIDAKVPAKSGVYEVKVWRAKKCAYIGHCESLRQKLTLHKLQHNSGHKHLDKFIERNKEDIQIRYEVFPTVDNAKAEVKNRVKSFTALYKTTPAYN